MVPVVAVPHDTGFCRWRATTICALPPVVHSAQPILIVWSLSRGIFSGSLIQKMFANLLIMLRLLARLLVMANTLNCSRRESVIDTGTAPARTLLIPVKPKFHYLIVSYRIHERYQLFSPDFRGITRVPIFRLPSYTIEDMYTTSTVIRRRETARR